MKILIQHRKIEKCLMTPLALFIFVITTSVHGSQHVTKINNDNNTSDIIEKELKLLNCNNSESIFQCSDSTCITNEALCDGVPDCPANEDEHVLHCGCLENEFRCEESCINMLSRCDRIKDCEMGEDELNCETHLCPITHFKCTNHFCIPLDLVCNFEDDCGDSSDEIKCVHRKCWNPEFHCENGQCIRPGFLCDGIENCIDGSDERHCTEDNFVKCGDGTDVHRYYWCDEWPDCQDNHADEINCGNCKSENMFKCANGRCIRNANVCDGQCDCISSNASIACDDEQNCLQQYTTYYGVVTCNLGSTLSCSFPGHKMQGERCIKKENICDGYNDCFNGNFLSDEFGCNASFFALDQELFLCRDGRYLPVELQCDYKFDCLHGDDEEGCGEFYKCANNERMCNNKQCILDRHWCDRHYDCWDKSDETDCDNEICPNGWRKCRYSGQCVPQSRWCDFHKDCPDMTDELNCEIRSCLENEFKCDNGQCIPVIEKCIQSGNPKMGCADESHLLNCHDFECSSEFFKCHRGPCLNKSFVCDGSIDCKSTWDDEDNCPFSCSRIAPECHCRDVHINCTDLRLSVFPFDAEKEITWFHLSGNRLANTITNRTMRFLDNILYLDISKNGIKTLIPYTFNNLWRLNVLNIQDNEISILQGYTFHGLSNLKGLHLQRNAIKEIKAFAFHGLFSLTTLDLHEQKISIIEKEAFLGLRNLLRLDLSKNEIIQFNDGAFAGLKAILYLDIRNNYVHLIEPNVFRAMTTLANLLTDEFRFCCLARHVPSCHPPPDEFSSCEDLMSNLVLRVCIWVLGTIATIANLSVIVFRGLHKTHNQVHSFLITNLAIADLLMGIYLLIIAFVDWNYRGMYFIHDLDWRSSQLCNFAGFTSTFSSELSVFTLTVITLDRFVVIIFPFGIHRLEMKRTRILMISCWIVVAIISTVPLPIFHIQYFQNYYGRSVVCLPLHITPDKPSGWEFSVFVFLFLNSVSFSIIAGSYLWMYWVARNTHRAAKRKSDTFDSVMAFRMTLLVATDAACWIPIILLGIWSLAGNTVDPQVFAWVAVFVLPLNAALNPILYTMSTATFTKPARKNIATIRRTFSIDRKSSSLVVRPSTDGITNDEVLSLASRGSSIRWNRKLDTIVIDQGEVVPFTKQQTVIK